MKTKVTTLIILFYFSLFTFDFSAELNATIRYVSKTGSSTPPYTSWATASDSIQKCIDICEYGDTIYVANGVYKEKIVMIPGLSLIGSGMDSCIIDSREFPLSTPYSTIRAFSDSKIIGFKLFFYDQQNGAGISLFGGNNIIKFNSINLALNGIIEREAGINIIENNYIIKVDKGVNSSFTNSLISNNIIINPFSSGFWAGLNSRCKYYNNIVLYPVYDGFWSGQSYKSSLKNNLFIFKVIPGRYSQNTAIGAFSGDTVINNVVIGRWYEGYSGSGSVIKNNHIEGTQRAAFYYTYGPPLVFQYNNLWRNEINYINFTGDSTNIYKDPMFVLSDSLDYRLQMYSPLIDAGDPDILDLDGTRSDIGLYGGPFGRRYIYQDLPPRAPVNLTAVVDTAKIILRWNRNTEADTSHYKIYRSLTANFTADSTTLIAATTDTFYIDILRQEYERMYYKVSCVDKQGNESEPSEEAAILFSTIKDYPITINDYKLYQNYPNPFNPQTKISYRLKEGGYVKLYVYNIKGEIIEILVNQYQEGGYYEVEFNIDNKNQSVGEGEDPLASGIYIYQIMVRSKGEIPVFTDSKKMLYIK